MSSLPTTIYSSAQIRQLENLAYTKASLSEDELMERAGLAAYEALHARWPNAQRIAVFCGSGNNGGDGYVLARLAAKHHYLVQIYQVGDHSQLKGPALNAARACANTKVKISPYAAEDHINADLIVDGIFGIGLNKDITDNIAAIINAINASKIPVFALDIPSGLHADHGTVQGVAVHATVTLTMIGLKCGLFTGAGAAYAGEVLCTDLKLPADLFMQVKPLAHRLDKNMIAQHLKPRSRDAYKGNFGHVLIIGGDYGMPGAVHMVAEAALRIGSGLVTVATRAEHIAVVSATRPEIMCLGVKDEHDLKPLLARATVIVIGPGLGRSTWSQQLFKAAIATNKSMVIDADGLYWLADDNLANNHRIITPHPGEAAHLLGTTIPGVQSDRLAAVAMLQQQYGGVAVLKGAGTLICGNSYFPAVCINGNPGMATAGMGDVLSGVIGGLLAQGIPQETAAQLGVLIHACAGDLAAEKAGERGLLAMDLMPYLRELVN